MYRIDTLSYFGVTTDIAMILGHSLDDGIYRNRQANCYAPGNILVCLFACV